MIRKVLSSQALLGDLGLRARVLQGSTALKGVGLGFRA